MDCDRFCEDLPDLLYGELPADHRERAEGHADGCASCQSLLTELRAVRGALPELAPPVHVVDRIKLAARDVLLAEQAPAVAARGGTLHAVAAVLLAACVCLAGFGLGMAYERGRASDPAPQPQRPRAAPPQPDADETWIEVQGTGSKPLRLAPSSQPPEAWQRVLHDAATERLRAGSWVAAREFFLAAAEIAPRSPLAAAAEVGAAEALLRRGERARAAEELERTRRRIHAGARFGDPSVLQRIAELAEEAAAAAGEGRTQDGERDED